MPKREKARLNLREYLAKNANVHELIVVKKSGIIMQTVYVGDDRNFTLDKDIERNLVSTESWGIFPVLDKDRYLKEIPCRFIELEE